jgi:hypothetical protein
VGLVDEYATNAKNYAELTENWQGVDVNVTARLRNGITAQGGTSTGRRYSDACAMKLVVPEYGSGTRGSNTSIAGDQSVTNPWCRVVEPYRTQVRGLASYTVPRIDVLISGTWSLTPQGDLEANWVVNNAAIAAGPQPLGRPLSGGAANVTVNILEPETVFPENRNNIDFRVSKIIRYGRTRTQVGFDIYNLTNADTATAFNQTFSPTSTTWLTPTTIVPARYVRFNVDVNF